MARRRNISDVLESRFECPNSWDDMQGGAERRFCAQCRCEVYDFAQMEPRAVKARLEASRGKMCARLTRVQGRLQMLSSPSPPVAVLPRKAERAPAIAAGLVGAWLTLATPDASAAPDPLALVAASAPAEPQEGEAVLPGGFSDSIEVTAALAIPVESVTVGMVVYADPTLRGLFDESELVFAGRVGSSEVLAVNDGIAEVRTVLRVARHFKGEVRDRFVTYRHSLPVEAFDPELLSGSLPELTPGSMVVAFLSPAEDETGRPLFEATGYSGGLRAFAADELAAYSERLDDLAALHRLAGPRGELDQAGLMEWLVAAAEDPLTREENTSREILSALEEFAEAASGPADLAVEASPGLGARLTALHAARLAAALSATRTMGFADLELFRLVRELDKAAAALWLVETLRSGTIPESGDIRDQLEEFAETLDGATARAFLDDAKERLGAIDRLWPHESSPEAEEAWRQQSQDLLRALFAELGVLLENDAH